MIIWLCLPDSAGIEADSHLVVNTEIQLSVANVQLDSNWLPIYNLLVIHFSLHGKMHSTIDLWLSNEFAN